MKIRPRKLTHLLLAGTVLAGGGLGLAAPDAMAHGDGQRQGVARAERGAHHGAAKAVMTAVKQLLNVDNADLKAAHTAKKSLTALADEKGVERAQLVSTIAAALKANRPAGAPALTDAQLAARAGKIAARVPGAKGPGAKGPGIARKQAAGKAVQAAVANAIGVTPGELKAARRAGTSPATLAQQKGVERSTVVNAVVAALKANRPAGAPGLTDAQLTRMAGKIVDNARPGRGPGGPRGHRR